MSKKPISLRQRKMRKLGLVEPDKHAKLKPDSKQFQALRKKWYAKLAKAESRKPEDKQWKDIEWADDPESPHIKKPASRGRQFVQGKELYYSLARNFLTHNKQWKRWEETAWRMHTEGISYRNIVLHLHKHTKCKKSVYWLFYFLAETRKRCYDFNKNDPEGLYFNSEISIEELTGMSRLAKGFFDTYTPHGQPKR